MLRLVALLILVASVRSQATYGACYGASTTCCFTLEFEMLPGMTNNATAGQIKSGQLLSPDTFKALGVYIWSDALRPRSTERYPLGFLNSSSVPAGEQWGPLKSTKNDGIVASLFDSLVPLRPLRLGSTDTIPSYTLHLNFSSAFKSTPACISSVRLLRTYSMDQRMSATVRLLDKDGEEKSKVSSPWSYTLRTNEVDLEFTTPNVNQLDITWSGFGFAALANVRACYPTNSLDACAVCGGNGASCGAPAPNAGPKPGDPCTNASMTNPVCQPGRYDRNLTCVPNLLNVTKEICNGVDDDCDGVIDQGATVSPITCGVGECKRTVYRCGYTGETFNSTCTPGEPTTEICDGLDNDCDGLIDEDFVCERPIEGVPVIPVGVCVEGRLGGTGPCYAHFGYFVKEEHFNVSIHYPSDESAILYPAATPALWQPTYVPSVPVFFEPGSHSIDAFKVELPACSGPTSSAVWKLGDGVGHYLEAEVDGDAIKPCEDGAYVPRTTLVWPITPIVDDTCIRRANGSCSIRLGYFNPNWDVPIAYLDIASGVNEVYYSGGVAGPKQPASVSTAPPPNLFTPGRVHDAYVATWQCPTGQETLHWVLVSGVKNVTKQAWANVICP